MSMDQAVASAVKGGDGNYFITAGRGLKNMLNTVKLAHSS